MSAWEHPSADRGRETEGAVFRIARPPVNAPVTPLIFASPHSGRIYPAPLRAASRLDATALRGSEDAHVDELIAEAPAHGATVISARLARVWLDVNREPWELDPTMFADELPAYARARTPRVSAGLGAIARVVREGEEIYSRKLAFAEAVARVEAVHRPYHAALTELLAHARRAHGLAILVDWHSMPSAATRQAGGGGAEIVLGDRYGVACAPAVSRRVEKMLQLLGYRVGRNTPYAGGYTTEHYGRPHQGVHALQVEISRGLYMDERTLAPTPGFDRLKADLERLFADLATAEWKTD